MKSKLIRADDYRIMNWKNGGGQTAEIALSPPQAQFPNDPFSWRLSKAEVKSNGPFSVFPGYDRYLLLIAGSPFRLCLEGQSTEVILQLKEPFHLKGEQKVESELLDGPITDLNLIYQREQMQAHFEVVSIKKKPRSFSTQGDEILIFGVMGSAEISVYPGEKKYKISAMDTLHIERSQGCVENDCLILIEPTSTMSEFALIELNYLKRS